MDLATWQDKYGVSDETLALAVGVTRPYISRLRTGQVNPSLVTALKVWEYTRRKVDLTSLQPLHMRPDFTPQPAPEKPISKPRKPVARKASPAPAAA
jgi:DNA-binding XRE family transcriptional regulator